MLFSSNFIICVIPINDWPSKINTRVAIKSNAQPIVSKQYETKQKSHTEAIILFIYIIIDNGDIPSIETNTNRIKSKINKNKNIDNGFDL